MTNLKGKVAVVTGGNSGIGFATAKELVTQGATVIITGLRKDAIEKSAKEIGATPFVADQASLSDTDNLVSSISEKFGKVDILVINAGIAKFASIELTQESLFDNIINVNFKGAYFTLSKFIPHLNDNASVVLVSSTSATVSSPYTSVYAASKAAINSLTKIAAVELASRKIRVNAVSPGPTATEIATKMDLDEATLKTMTEELLKQIPLSKFGIPEDVAKLITYLSGNDASFITGSEFVIDGGLMIKQ